MKSNTFNYSLLAVGVAAVMGLSTGASAANVSGNTSNGAAAIDNQATATYSVGNGTNAVVQPKVVSNTVTVNVTETANFSLFAINGTVATDDMNENISITPNSTATFEHILQNNGNVSDTYTINTTGDNDSNITTATPTDSANYTLPAGADVQYAIRGKNNTALNTEQQAALTALSQSTTGTLNSTNGRTIKLPPGTEAALSYVSAKPTNRTGGDIAVGTLTATSTFITNAPNPTTGTKIPKLVNENQTIVRLPTFKITKTATCTNAPSPAAACSTLDLTAATPTINYSITVANIGTTAYKDTATDFVIRDALPAGMTLANGATSVTTTNGTVTASNVANSPQVIDVAVPSLAAGSEVVITFQVNVNKATYDGANASATNNVAVYDKFVGAVGTLPASPTVTTDYDILDSTVATNDVTRVPAAADATGGAGVDTASTVKFSRRNLTLAEATTREIAPITSTTNTNGQVTHTATITNNGQDIEGNSDNPLTLTITDGTNAQVNPVFSQFVLVYTTKAGVTSAPIAVTPTQSGNVYTVSSTQFPGGAGIEAGGKLEVRYNMESIAITGFPGTGATVGSTENTVVQLTAGGTNAPTIAAITDITNVKGLTLLKEAAVQDKCTGTIPAYQGAIKGDGSATILTNNAKPGDCIYYKITANNTFTTISNTAINNVVLSDLTSQWKPKSAYQPNTATSTGGGAITIANPNVSATEAVTTTLPTLAAGASGNLTFAIKVGPQ